jgi:hypothetical protein
MLKVTGTVETGPAVGMSTVAGYTVIRRIGSGSRAEVVLGRSPVPAGRDGRGGGDLVAVKVFRPARDAAGIGLEVRALLAAPTVLVGLRDVATTPDGRVCLVTDHVPGPTLDRVLESRGRLGAGEIVTIAATVTATLQALHDAGLSHPLVRANAVRFADRGRPVLLGLGALVELPGGVAGVQMRRDAAVALTGFLRVLIGYLDPTDTAAVNAPALVAEFEAVTLSRPFPSSLVGLEAALFAWAPAGPVRGAVPGPGTAAEPTSMPEVTPVPAVIVPRTAGPGPVPTTGGRHRLRERVIGALAALQRAVPGWVRPQRVPARPLLAGLGLAVALVLLGVTVLEAVEPGSGSGPGSAAAGVQSTPTAAATLEAPGEVPDEEDDRSVVDGDDPAAAALVLIRQRAGCLVEASVLCLDNVDQLGSVAMAADGYLVRQLQSGPDSTAAAAAAWIPTTAELRERTGNAALVVLTRPADGDVNAQPASALVIKGEAGWRLRELFDY